MIWGGWNEVGAGEEQKGEATGQGMNGLRLVWWQRQVGWQ